MSSALTMWLMFQAGTLTPWRILGLGCVGGLAAGFQSSAWQSFIPLLVPPHDMLHAVRLNSTQFNLARALGPGFAGVVIATWGTGAAILVNALTYPLVIAVLVVSNPRANSVVSKQDSVLTSLREGARYVWNNHPIRLAVLVGFVASACGQSLQHVSAAVASRVFDRASTENAGLLTALGLGALAASLVQAVFGSRIKRSQSATIAFAMAVVSTAMIAATSNYAVGLAGYAIAGFGHLTIAMALNTLIQGTVPDEVRGRAVSYYLFGVLLGIPLGSFCLGRIGDLFSMRTALWVDVAVLTGVTGVLAARRSLRAFDRDEVVALSK